MKWNVFYHNVNTQKIETFNIFKHYTFNEYVKQHLKECQTKEEFAEKLKSELHYYFWCKAEYEVIISPWCGGRNTEDIKVDIYTQVINNFDVFVDYVWNNRENFENEVG